MAYSHVMTPSQCGPIHPFQKLTSHISTDHAPSSLYLPSSSSSKLSFRTKKPLTHPLPSAKAMVTEFVNASPREPTFIDTWHTHPPALSSSPSTSSTSSLASPKDSGSWAQEFDQPLTPRQRGPSLLPASPPAVYARPPGHLSPSPLHRFQPMPVSPPTFRCQNQAPPSQTEWNSLFDQVELGHATAKTDTTAMTESHPSTAKPLAPKPLHTTLIDTSLDSRQDEENNTPTEPKTDSAMDAQAWTTFGFVLQESDHDAAAIHAFKQALDLDAGVLDAWMGMALSLVNQRERRLVYDCLENWLLQHDQYRHLLTHYDTSDINNDALRHDHLIQHFLSAARLGHMDGILDTDIQVILGILFFLDDELPKAVDCFQTAVVQRPDDHRLWNQLGAMHAAMHSLWHHREASAQQPHLNRAMELYQTALQLHPTYVRASYNLAIAYMTSGQYLQAAHHLVQSLSGQASLGIPTTMSLPLSSSIWSSLRLVMFLLKQDELAQACNTQDLTAFQDYLHMH
ncbi:TPR-like protein [Hesseltinella vesiculosa]|uniref:TPR-like protein n=1 Tax=Hesseltinella vesiculosa TaxID=101127 RepID=A0A1X2GH84_9FUNG|nr:TPR-like protein [Hesseltinella vesiculosa]